MVVMVESSLQRYIVRKLYKCQKCYAAQPYTNPHPHYHPHYH